MRVDVNLDLFVKSLNLRGVRLGLSEPVPLLNEVGSGRGDLLDGALGLSVGRSVGLSKFL